MKVMKVLMTLSLLFRLCLCFTLRSHETTMIVDVVKSYERPTAVVAKLCWNFSEKRTLMMQLMRKNKSVSFIADQKEIQKFEAIDTIIVIDLNCQDNARLFQQANEKLLRGSENVYRWLILNNEFGSFSTELTNLTIQINSEVIVAEKMSNDTFILNLVYRIDLTGEFRTEEFGIWTGTDGLKLSKTVTKTTMVLRRRDLHGKAIAASYVITDNSTKTKIHELDYRDLKFDNIAKVTHHNILPLYYFMNATETMLFTDTWGYFINNSWNGMVGDMQDGKAELGGAVSFMSLQRLHIVQYITQPIHVRLRFVFRKPALSFQNNLFILPFRGSVWMAIGGIVMVLIVIIYINAKWEAAKDEDMVMKDSTILKPNVSDIGIFVISAITQQGSTHELKGSLGRVVTFFMFLSFLFLYTSYSANIVALLQSSSNQIRTLTDLLNSKLELGVEDEKYNRYYFTTNTEPVRKAIYDNKIAKVGHKPNFMSIDEGVRRLRNKDVPFAFHMNEGLGYRVVEEVFLEHEKCGLHEISYYPNSVPWVFSKRNTPYIEIYKVGLARIFEHGLGERVNQILYSRKPVCSMRGGSFTSVNMVDFHPVLIWMLYGIILSVILLVLEILMHRRQRRGLESPTS